MSKPYIAKAKIFFGTALGYNVGDEVNDDVVKAHGLEDSVTREGSKAADKAHAAVAEETGGLPVAEQLPNPK